MNNGFLYIICNFEVFSTVNSSMASKMAAKMKNPIFWWYFAVLSKKSSLFAISCFFVITNDVSCQWTVHNQGRTGYIHSTKTKNNGCMLGTTCFESKAADVSWSKGWEVYGVSTMCTCNVWLQAARGCL